jgi:hypothetical protein
MLSHPLVSPVNQPTLGGLPPLLIMVGGGEILRDEQIYVAHKCANPPKYLRPEDQLTDSEKIQVKKYRPTDVQLQVWEDLCHVAPTLSFTRPAKHMYRSIAQFGAWALARAQQTGIDILDDDAISIISSSDSEIGETLTEEGKEPEASIPEKKLPKIGKSGDPLPPFKNHMIRQRVTRHGHIYPLAASSHLPGCMLNHCDIGVIREEPVKRWLESTSIWDTRYASTKAKVQKKIIKDMAAGYLEFGEGERPPPSALAGRRKIPAELIERKRTKSFGLALWSLWGSKHDEMTVEREQKAEQEPEMKVATAEEGSNARSFGDISNQEPVPAEKEASRTRSRRRTVTDENQTGRDDVDENTPVNELIALRKQREAAKSDFLSPDYTPETGVAGKRPMLEGIALPFSLRKEADSASMVTLMSGVDPVSRPISPVPPASSMSNLEPDSTSKELPGMTSPTLSGIVTPSSIETPRMERFFTPEEIPPVDSKASNT